jgi:MSHA biogenesis protein MshP
LLFGALAAFMMSFSTSENMSSAQDVMGARALQAARSGIEWGAYQILQPEKTDNSSQYKICPTTSSFSPGAELSDFTVTVNIACSLNEFTEGGNLITMYTLTATSCSQPDGGACPNSTGTVVGGLGYVERQVSVTIGTCRKSPDGIVC